MNGPTRGRASTASCKRRRGKNIRPRCRFPMEIPLSEDVLLTVEGRCDGIICAKDGVTIDEIKTTEAPFELVTEDFNPLHWAQAKCYGAIYCSQNGVSEITLQLTYYQMETGEIKRFSKLFSKDELWKFFNGLIADYQKWALFRASWEERRDASLRALAFPFPTYRKGQKALCEAVYKTILTGQKLFCQAPTGIGKTMSTLFPAMKAVGEGKVQKVFYLTAKTVTRAVAGEALAVMRGRGVFAKAVTLCAKDKICFLEERSCNPEACPYADGHFDRVNDALFELLTGFDAMDKDAVQTVARAHRVCPFELSLDATLFADVIICDYNHLFDPVVYLKRFFQNKNADYVFLIDEAHNLLERAREMYSAQLSKREIFEVKKEIGKTDAKLAKLLTALNSEMLAVKKEMGEKTFAVSADLPKNLAAAAERFCQYAGEFLAAGIEALPLVVADMFVNLYFSVSAFLRVRELYGEAYRTLFSRWGSEVTVKLFCVDPAGLLAACMDRGRASVLFSATLSPMGYFMKVLGGGEGAYNQRLASPFLPENLCLLAADGVSTRYKNRAQSLETVADMIYETAASRAGNYMAFFPSYEYMNSAFCLFCEKYPQIEAVLQQPGMAEDERAAFLASFDAGRDAPRVAFCVMGGLFSEGIDLKGERLIGVIIVGVGLPKLENERNVIRDFYNQEDGCGYEFAYQYPGMNKVLQAVGRVIRQESDRGVALLIDDRFTTPATAPCIPTIGGICGRCARPARCGAPWQIFGGKIKNKGIRDEFLYFFMVSITSAMVFSCL